MPSPNPVRWNTDGTVTVLPLLPGGTGGQAVAINDHGVVVGTSGGVPVRWTGSTPTTLPLLAGDFRGFAVGVNRTGVVAGLSGDPFARGVVWDAAGAPTELGAVPGGQNTSVNDLNDRGDVVGNMRMANGDIHAVRW